ncbi:MAG TPA: AMP-binding protein [Acidimicrobiales bacterium]|nr:AMP-binding protein [Acidimicrobiales bacterium]
MSEGNANLAVLLETRARDQGWLGRTAYLAAEGEVSHGAVHGGAARAATVLAGLGTAQGDRVMIALPDGPELVQAFLGAVRLGAVAVPVNPSLTAGDHRQLAGECRPRVVVCGSELGPRFAGCVTLGGDDLAAKAAQSAEHRGAAASAGSPAYAQFTSGTTGRPKAAVHRHGDPMIYQRAFAEGAIDLGVDDVVLSISKMHFAYGLGNSLFFPLLTGCRAVLLASHPRAEVVTAMMQRHRVTVLFAVPTFYARLASSSSFATGEQDWTSAMRVAVSAGEVLTVALAQRCRAFLGCPVLDGLGSTEVGQTFVSNTLSTSRDGTVGRPLEPYEVSVRDGLGRRSAPGALGTLWVRGPTVLLEYLDQPALSAAVRDGEWLCTSDRAVVDDDGFVALRGRIDDIELVGGINVAPTEVEEVLSTLPGVMEVAVAGVRDGAGRSQLEAFVVAGPDVGQDLGAEVIEVARGNLARHMVPRAVHMVDHLPRTSTGKLRRFVLRSGEWSESSVARLDRPPTSGQPTRSGR